MKSNNELKINVDTSLLDEAIEKATRLCEITNEAQTALANKKVEKLNWVLLAASANKKVEKLNWVLLATSGGLVLANVILLLRQLL